MSQNKDLIRKKIQEGNTALGIELGSTRIKAVLIDDTMAPVAQGSYGWENQLIDGIWTYDLVDIMKGLQESYRDLARDVETKYDVTLTCVGSLGVSAMMHGYLPLNDKGELLVPFRTWRNTMTQEAAEKLTDLFQYNIPQRWSIAHLYQAVLNKEEHLPKLSSITTLAGYIHWRLTDEMVLGVGDASGMFPIDIKSGSYDEEMIARYEALSSLEGYSVNLKKLLPRVLSAGEKAGKLTKAGAGLLDETGKLEAGIDLCPPEGDAGTGMVATNSVGVKTGNVSAGTSVFAMVVLEKELSAVYPEIDLVTTPDGSLVGMVHCNNCTSDLNAWVNIFREYSQMMGIAIDENTLYEKLYQKALEGEKDCGGLLSYCYLSGEPITGLEEGRPMFIRMPDSHFNLANFMRTHLYSSLATLKLGFDILFGKEKVSLEQLMGHGGFFKTKGVGQQMMATAAGVPVCVMETAGEGGAWGIALLAYFIKQKETGETLDSFLKNRVFSGEKTMTSTPDPQDIQGFETFISYYRMGLKAQQEAVRVLPS